MRALWLAALAGIILVAILAWPSEDRPRFEVHHFDSRTDPGGFEEVFELRAVVGTVATANVTVWVDGEQVPATWHDEDGVLSVGDRFSFIMEAFDFQRDLWLEHDGTRLWTGSFGSGAGTPV